MLTEYFSSAPPTYPDVDLLSDASFFISPDGKKHFYFVDRGITEPIALYIYDLGKKEWSPKYTTKGALNGGILGPIVMNDTCGENCSGKLDNMPGK